MTQAAKQCREYIEAKYPGVRIGRLACRDTASGGISQHSAFDGYDSNALDIMGGPPGWTREENVELIQEIVDDITLTQGNWSVREILWQVPNHFGHAHIDFYPMCMMHKWCGGPETPEWEYSTGATIESRDPQPENGLYNGEVLMPEAQWHQMIDALFAAGGEFHGDPDYWKQLDPDSPEWEDFWAAFVRSIS